MSGITINDLNNAQLDVAHIEEIATSALPTATDRLGGVKKTMAGAIASISGINVRGAWSAITAYATKDVVSNSGTWYVCVVAHTSSASFSTDVGTKWRVYQGVVDAELFVLTGDNTNVQAFIDAAGSSEKITIKGAPTYDESINWKGRRHDNAGGPHLLNSVTWSGADLNARMCVANGWLFVSEYANGKIGVFSLADPRNPQWKASLAVGAAPRHVEVCGRYMFVCLHGDSEIKVYDISNPGSVALVGTISTGTNPKMFQIVGSELFVACYGDSTVEKYSFRLPLGGLVGFSSNLEATVSVSAQPLCLAHNGVGLIAVCGLGTANIDMVGASTLNLISSAPIGSAGHATCVWANKTQLLVTDSSNNRLYSLDCYTLTAVVSSYATTSTAPEQIEIVGNRAYVPSLTASGVQAYLDCFDITDAKNPYKFASTPLSVTGAGFTAYFTDGQTGYVYVNGHSTPFNLDIVEVIDGPSGRPPAEVSEYFAAQKAAFGSIEASSATLGDVDIEALSSLCFSYETKTSNYSLLDTDFVIRAGSGGTITMTLLDPASVRDGKVQIIKNVGGNNVVVANGYTGYSGTLAAGEGVILMASFFSGTYQWDLIAAC